MERLSELYTYGVLTISDSCSDGSRNDLSGPTIIKTMDAAGYRLVTYRVVPDGLESVSEAIRETCSSGVANLLLTTGGTGLSPRDWTPEATESVCSRMVPGIPEMIRLLSSEKVASAWLSRGSAGILNWTLVINLPGSVKAVEECTAFILPILGHALEVLCGNVERCGG